VATAANRVTLAGTVASILYRNETNRYLVLSMRIPGRSDLITATGYGRSCELGAEVEAQGKWVEHPKYGRQFEFARLVEQTPTGPGAVARRLSLYPGIGAVTAERVVAKFGEQTLTILDEQPRRLLEVKGIGAKGLDRILLFHAARSGPLAHLEDRLAELDLSPRLAKSLHARYGDDALLHLESDPFQLARDVRGIGFRVADRIAQALGLASDSPTRVDAGVTHCVREATQQGHCALMSLVLRDRACDLLRVDEDAIAESLSRLFADGFLEAEAAEGEEIYVFDPEMRAAEQRVAKKIAALALSDRSIWEVPPHPENLGAAQRAAVEAVARAGFTVLTGGPGTGKSTVVAQVLALAERNDVETLLAAPTGRAAKRLEVATGTSAKTIHRLLEIQPMGGHFGRGADDPLPAGLLVVDETSMLDVLLADALLSALTPAHRVLWVGDSDQLPSVGPGQVLRDVIEAAGEACPIPVVRLDKIYRQDESSSIVTNAHLILRGESLDPDEPNSGGSFFVLRSSDERKTHEQIVEMATERVPQAYSLSFPSQIQVLAPMRRGAVGTEALNEELQRVHSHGQPGIDVASGGGMYRVGDRVLQLRNDYERGVFNGDVGEVARVDQAASSITVDFGGQVCTYEQDDLRALGLAYAMTIHKSQGSEFPAVVIPLVRGHGHMLRRNLVYTAITRAKRLCVIAGDGRAIERAIRSVRRDARTTTLRRRIYAEFRDTLGTLTIVPHDDVS
jgi:exodeoxyribonuclease V alpha subunit